MPSFLISHGDCLIGIRAALSPSLGVAWYPSRVWRVRLGRRSHVSEQHVTIGIAQEATSELDTQVQTRKVVVAHLEENGGGNGGEKRKGCSIVLIVRPYALPLFFFSFFFFFIFTFVFSFLFFFSASLLPVLYYRLLWSPLLRGPLDC
ncbi:uncharacterized protein BO88DRAFT_142507 [Aspergillus vadensis CBS 113365]|uniref:Uncharacterized protein n=1 Tax=Aspergillus vadensis (strain CBS 113365 / IMI 142717 / IBT 24658) TaxID=1448311 RepID=A0A319AYR3_ASPVC|nr:hypothetical protein BO88DRAFT_142507 [Aspergillus vadensis CBS 113365]PYH65526.1 hypothetical protein BO88DRAFT_142507 [Aspergillus vadensis CBS 113365]